jgi:hypothetical protein
MSEDMDASTDPNTKRRRRRRKRPEAASFISDDVLLTEGEPKRAAPAVPAAKRAKGRRQAVDISGPVINVPSTGRNPHKKRNSRPKRNAPKSAVARRRKLSKSEVETLHQWLEKMPVELLGKMYKGLGGQPGRVPEADRMMQLTVRALTKGTRIDGILKHLNERDRKALAALVQCGGVAQDEEFLRELILSFGGSERDWKKSMSVLASRGFVFATALANTNFFYVIPEPLMDGLVHALDEDLSLPTFEHEEMRITEQSAFCPPLEFSITSLATYIDQNGPRLSQRQEIYRVDQEEMDVFFSQLWSSNSELFKFHLDFLMMHKMVELRGEYLALNRDVLEEWLGLESEDQRDLIFRALDRHFHLGEWVLWAIQGAGGDWVAERPLAALYRRWKRGESWRSRYLQRQIQSTRTAERESFSFAPLVSCGLLELGQWGQEKFYRLSPRGAHLLTPPKEEGFQQFYLTPSFEIMAPAGLAPILLFRIGELAQLVGCDRANTYKINDTNIESALNKGWRRDDVLQFLRDNSQIGLPENVEQTLKGWIGHTGDVEFHNLMLLTVHRSQVRRFESKKSVKPYILHRFAPGMYAIDPSRKDEIVAMLRDTGFDPARDSRSYPGDPEQVEARAALRRMVAEAREASIDPKDRGAAMIPAEQLIAIPGTTKSKASKDKASAKARTDPAQVKETIDKAMAQANDIEMVYRARNGEALTVLVQPQRLAFKAEAPVLVGLDRKEDARRTYLLERIEQLKIVAAP